MPLAVVIGTFVFAGLLALLVGLRVEVTRTREGKVLAFIVLFLAPIGVAQFGFAAHMERAESTQFCLSCHVMQPFGKSLTIDDPSYIPARHAQNHLVPADHACYTCHSDYTMFGPVKGKLTGLRHMYVEYFGTVPAPKDIKLYQPYKNENCLHCHLGQRKFEEATAHHKAAELLAQVKSGAVSCVKSGCHEFIHDVDSLKDQKFWKGGDGETKP